MIRIKYERNSGNTYAERNSEDYEIMKDTQRLEKKISELKDEVKERTPNFFTLTKRALMVNLLVVLISLPVDFYVFNLLSFRPIFVSIERDNLSTSIAKPDFAIPSDLQRSNVLKYNKELDRLELNKRLQMKERDALLLVNKSYSKEIEKLWTRSHPFGDIDVNPVEMFWLPFMAFLIFLGIAYRCYYIMEGEYRKNRIPNPNALEEIEGSYNNLIDIIGFSMPLLGAAILLLSVLIGTWLFVNFSVPFEIKAIMVLVLSKSFTMVTDKITDEYRIRLYKKIKVKEFEDRLRELHESEHEDITMEHELERLKREDKRHEMEEAQFNLLRNAMFANMNYDPSIIDSFERSIKNNAAFSKQVSDNLEKIVQLSSELERVGNITRNFVVDLRPFSELTKNLISGLKDQGVQLSIERLTSFAKSLASETNIKSAQMTQMHE